MTKLKVNGQEHQIEADGDTPLLYVLRDELKLNAAKSMKIVRGSQNKRQFHTY